MLDGPPLWNPAIAPFGLLKTFSGKNTLVASRVESQPGVEAAKQVVVHVGVGPVTQYDKNQVFHGVCPHGDSGKAKVAKGALRGERLLQPVQRWR